jgi:hypothetical protein
MTSSEPVVDIGMPTLGESAYLVEAIESILAQTFQSWRLLVSENGAGRDEMRAQIEPYLRDPRIAHSVVGDRISQAANWTRSLADGRAPYAAMLHDDDCWDTGFLSKRVAFLDEHPTCGFVFAGYRVVTGTGELVKTVEADLPEGVLRSASILPIMYEHNLVAPPAPLIRRASYDAVGGAFKDVLLPDYEMWLRLAAEFDVGHLSVSDSDYRLHSRQVTTRIRAGIGRGHLEVIDATEDLPVPPGVRRRARGHAHLLCAIDCVELGDRREALRQLRAALRVNPSLLLEPGSVVRIVLALVAMIFGERGRRGFLAWRTRRHFERSGGTHAG